MEGRTRAPGGARGRASLDVAHPARDDIPPELASRSSSPTPGAGAGIHPVAAGRDLLAAGG